MIPDAKARLKLVISGAVQGVGFRPFVSRLANELHVAGWVNNTPQGVLIEAEASPGALQTFVDRLRADHPAGSHIRSVESSWVRPTGSGEFEIRSSSSQGVFTAAIMPDMATCPDCLREMLDPANRRHRYPFINCTRCGPRFSIIQALPYDRAHTSMKKFKMCDACQAEYDNPADRRYHAQPNACPECGPQLSWMDAQGRGLHDGEDALQRAVQMLRGGSIVAVKGVGGYHLMADATNDQAVLLLRQRKQRRDKPMGLLFPSLALIKKACVVSPNEEGWLLSRESPLVLLKKLRVPALALAESVAPGCPCLGVMLPSNPLHHLLAGELGLPLIATSGNLCGEPICIDEAEAMERLKGIADGFLTHDRPVVRPVDDSIIREAIGEIMVLRRARGFAPLPVSLSGMGTESNSLLAVGGHLKNSIALAVGSEAFLSQHIGDLETEPASRAFAKTIQDFQKLYGTCPDTVAVDLHPDYQSTRHANESGFQRVIAVQHHVAHALSCITENQVGLPALAVIWDGTGLGTDGTLWGGEFFVVRKGLARRVGHIRAFRLPGGEAAVREPRRAALGLLYEMHGPAALNRIELPSITAFKPAERKLLATMLSRNLNCPVSSGMGRLFDAVASLLGVRQQNTYEGQAAMELEAKIKGGEDSGQYEIPILTRSGFFIADWQPMIESLLLDARSGMDMGVICARFHNALASLLVELAGLAGLKRVALSGGCFQNLYLLETTVKKLQGKNHEVFWQHRVPTNDGGLTLGQLRAVRQHFNLD